MNKSSLIILSFFSLLLQGCFTGIESTPKISDSEVKREVAPPRPEETFLTDIRHQPISEWQQGKQWFVTDSKIKLIFGASVGNAVINETDILSFVRSYETTTITGEKVAELTFATSRGEEVTYRTAQSLEALGKASKVDIPFAVEMSIVDDVRQRMNGKTYYVITSAWYDTNGQAMTGRRFIPVTVKEVLPGNAYYPILLNMIDDTGQPFRLYMSVGADSTMPRRFNSILSLSNPRLRYPTISDSNWNHIINGEVATDMTRDECRLALGSPTAVDRRPGYSIMHEIWTYEDGKYLIFEDGLLRSFRQ